MAPDKKKIYIVSMAAMAVLIFALFAPMDMGRPMAAVLLLPVAVAAFLFIKKRSALSLNTPTIILIMGVLGAVYLMGYYSSALFFGFTRTGYGLKADVILTLTLPVAGILVFTELLRYVLCAQKRRLSTLAAFVIGLLGDVIICTNIAGLTNYSTFMDLMGLTLFPGLLSNLLYNYLSSRYGWMPNLIYRGLTVWAFYLIPYGSAISDSLMAFINLLLPIAIYFFIDFLFEKKRRYALQKLGRIYRTASGIITIVVLTIMLGMVLLISNQFRFGAYVIATESMTGELNKGDIALFERYDDQFVAEGQVIVFEQSSSMIIHRVVDIEIINGVTRY